jgi:MFS family permease
MATATTISFSKVTSAQRHTLIAAALGWLLDGFDVMLYALVITSIVAEFGITKATAGKIATLTLLASGVGGVLFGWIADRIGRTKALMLSILTYSLCSFASGLATSIIMLAICRFILGFGMGGEWNTGATLVAETWPAELRAKAISMVQSTWALGYAAAALVAGFFLRYFKAPGNWRLVFFVGVLPALVVLWIRKDVPESEMWLERKQGTVAAPQIKFSEIFSRSYIQTTMALLFMNFFGMFAWWGLFTWIPSYLQLPVSKGGRGFDVALTTIMLVALNLTGMFPGYGTFGWVADRLGRKKSCILYILLASLLVLLYARATDPRMLLLLGTPVAFFATGFFSGSGIIGSEVFPTRVRARALGFTYNGARTISSIAPTVIGYVGQKYGLGSAFYLCAASLFLSMLSATQLPETKGKVLD